MTQLLNLLILSPVETILNIDKVQSIRVRLKGDSWLSIYPGHAPLLAELMPDKLVYSIDGSQAEVNITSGIMKVSKNQVTVFVSDPQNSAAIGHNDQQDRFDTLARKLMETMVNQKLEEVDSRE